MRAFLLQVALTVSLCASPLAAEEPLPWEQLATTTQPYSTPTRRTEIWGRSPFAQEAIYQRAAMRAAQRHERMAAQQALGYSPSRPPASTVPSMSSPGANAPLIGVRTGFPGTIFRRTATY